jgi:hypothetical protein
MGAWQDRPDFLRRKQKQEGESPTEVLPATGAAAPGAIAPVAPSAPSADPETARLDRLERLAAMHERGVLTDEEFAEEKARVRGEGG